MARASKKTATKAKTKTGRVNKSAWIRSQPVSLSAKAVVDKAEGQGITLSLAQVYTARSTAKRQPAVVTRADRAPAPRGPGRPKGTGSKAVPGDLRRQFMVIAVRIGTNEAQRLLDRIVDVETES